MIKKITAMLADIDGTLTMKGGELMPLTKQAIQRLHREGVLFGVASGRPLDVRTKLKAQEWGLDFDFDIMIGMNGGDLWTKEDPHIHHYYLLDTDTLKDIVSWLRELDVNAICYWDGYDDVKCLRMDEMMRASQVRNHSKIELVGPDVLYQRPTGKIEVHYDPADEEKIMKIIASHQTPAWSYVRTFRGTVEFMDPRLNKGVALKEFSRSSGIPESEIIAFGDMDNDIGLIKEAGWGVCLANGCDACKQAADAVTEHTVFDDGVGHYLYDHWFKQ